MREETLIKAMGMHDSHINNLHAQFDDMTKIVDKTYLQSLIHMMMWDVLLDLLSAKGVFTKEQFDQALKALSEKTKAAIDAEAKKKAEDQLKTEPLNVLQ